MIGQSYDDSAELAHKIARLVEERGWNQEDFVRITQLNRQTVRRILLPNGKGRLRNTTVAACAKALGVNVSDLRGGSLESLLVRVRRPLETDGELARRRLYDRATQPQVLAWIERNPERARRLTDDEMDELLSLQGTGGPLTSHGVEYFLEQIERKRALVQKVHAIAGTEYVDLLERLVDLLFEKVQPYPMR
jgi:hypothetical protein